MININRNELLNAKILSIRLGNNIENDEINTISTRGMKLIIFCPPDQLRNRAGNNIKQNLSNLSYNNVIKYIKSNITSLDVYTDDGEKKIYWMGR